MTNNQEFEPLQMQFEMEDLPKKLRTASDLESQIFKDFEAQMLEFLANTFRVPAELLSNNKVALKENSKQQELK